ncbi:putative hydrolase of the alpha/beta-hydrolase fold protein [Enhygromyxa salina]|uniref:Putative hydrolase of the alpha/beta-hydrolase fold protein n=1 Tax=Enhygromyxa salina TaxID=215803 RepID=A0A0C1ZIT3_9BACT|nr:alpha/beta family hydrolase [Enhygromyxa salina]KIG17444.1 putative hydrolase of the alpha/beta-hydrolase fold protein [Enhygromyxa salina]
MTTIVLGCPAAPLPSSMAVIIAAIERAGITARVAALDPTSTDDAAHEQRYRVALAGVQGPVILGGFSLGGRIAARLCPELAPQALLCLGYPFHVRGQPRARHGLEALGRVRVPTLIIQGTRDPHGSEADVCGYALPDTVQLAWLQDGNHHFVPRERSGHTHAQHLAAAGAAAIAFIQAR